MRFILCVAFLALSTLASAETAQWMRDAAISPDGTQIAFRYRGEICVVSTRGGEARVLTRSTALDAYPIWAPDSKSLVFSSKRNGNFDLYTFDLGEGDLQRLTWHSADDRAWQVLETGEILFSSARGDAASCSMFPTGAFDELYSITLAGKNLHRLLTTPAHRVSRNADGDLLYEDVKGYEDAFRKHHISSVTRDIWLAPANGSEHRKLSRFEGEDLNPVWDPDGMVYYWLSEESGNLNVWRHASKGPEQISFHQQGPVRSLSISDTGVLCYTHGGKILLQLETQSPRVLDISVTIPLRSAQPQTLLLDEGASDFVLSPTGREIVFCLRGDLFVCSSNEGTTRRLTETPWEEKEPNFSPGGDSLIYVSRKSGDWRMRLAIVEHSDPVGWMQASRIAHQDFGPADEQPSSPSWSPNGKMIVYGAHRSAIHLIDVDEPLAARTIIPLEQNYNYTDQTEWFSWSPDSRWLALDNLTPNRWSDDVYLVNVDSGMRFNLSESGYEAYQPYWSEDGQSLYWMGDRFGLRSHGSYGGTDDLFYCALSDLAWQRHNLDEERFELLKSLEDSSDVKEFKHKKKRRKQKSKKISVPSPELTPQKVRGRIERVTPASARIASSVVLDEGETVLLLARFETSWNLWKVEPRKGGLEMLAELGLENPADLRVDREHNVLYILSADEGFYRYDLEQEESSPIGWQAEFSLTQQAEWQVMLDHVELQVHDRFYDPDLHGKDWSGICNFYREFIPDVDTVEGFVELLSEMLGELNASHTGAFARVPMKTGDRTAELGLIFEEYPGNGLLIAEVLKDGPADIPDSRIVAGAILVAVNGVAIGGQEDLWPLLNRQQDQVLELNLQLGREEFRQTLRPWGYWDQRQKLYERWVQRNEELVDSLSHGLLGYVHIRSMDDASFRRLYHRSLGAYAGRKALVVDTRNNGGGALTDDLVQFFSGKRLYRDAVPPDRRIVGEEPWERWTRPVIVVMDESNYSDSHIFPHAMRESGLARLVGMPVAGTGTAVWWESLMDGQITFGIPEVGLLDEAGNYLENHQLEPDLRVDNLPLDLARGRDAQLESAVRELLKECDGTQK